MKKYLNEISVTRVKNDVNGNPRLVIHWLVVDAPSYPEALAKAKKLGGRKFHNKQYGGGIVFQSYASCLQAEIESILKPEYKELKK